MSAFRLRLAALRLELAQLGRNLLAGLRVPLFLPVSRLAFRIDLAQLLLLFILSALLDVATDWIRVRPDGQFSWYGAGSEFIAAGMLLFCSTVLALAFRQQALVIAVPLLALAGYPLIQIVHALAGEAASSAAVPEWVGNAIDLAFFLWTFLLFVRSVAIALFPARPYHWPRAIAGGLLLALPIALAPALSPSAPWWRSTSAPPAEGRYPNAASEPVMAAQQSLLDDALSNLEDERSGEVDLYFVAFAGDAREPSWRADVTTAQQTMDERWDTRGRSIVLLNNPETLLDTPMATVTNLRETLKEIAAAINTEEDVVMLYLAGPAAKDGALDVAMPPLDLAPVAPSALRKLLDDSGIQWRIVVVAACQAGEFAEKLASDTTLVLVASGDGATYGCQRSSEGSNLGTALFGDALAKADALRSAFEKAHARIVEREGSGAANGAGARLVIGPAMAEKLKELDRTRATRRSSRSI